MTLYELIVTAFPELNENLRVFSDGTINLQNDGDGDYIREWNYEKPLTTALKKFLKN